LPLLFDVVIE